jgi:hypothetical protein
MAFRCHISTAHAGQHRSSTPLVRLFSLFRVKVATVAGAIWTTVVEMQFRGTGFFRDVNIQQQLGIAADRLNPAR